MLQYKLLVKRTLAACTDKDGAVDLRFLTKVTAEPHYVVGERYVVNYPALSGWSKTSAFELQTKSSCKVEPCSHATAFVHRVVVARIGMATGQAKRYGINRYELLPLRDP